MIFQHHIFGFGTKTLTDSNKEMKNIIKIDRFLETCGLLIKEIHKKIKKESKEQKSGSLSTLLNTIRYKLLWKSI